MRVMVMVKASESSEAGKMPDEKLMTDMGNFNEKLVEAGIMKAGEGLKPSSQGVRVHFQGSDRTVTDGPFAETKELIAGYWIWEVSSMSEAIDWVRRCPNPMMEDSDIEIRPIFEMADFGDEMTPELREQEAAIERKTQNDAEAEVRRMVHQWTKALEARDYDGLVANYTEDSVLFGGIPPYKTVGPQNIRKLWEGCLPHFPEFKSVHQNLTFEVGDDVAFVHGLHQFQTSPTDHPAGQSWMRVTICFRKMHGQWRVLHEHVSLPFNPMTNEAWKIKDPAVLDEPSYGADACT